MEEKISKLDILKLILMAVTGISVAVTGVIFEQELLKILPLFISLVVMYLNSKVNRFGVLLGGINSILYTVAYALMGLYGQAVYALLFSFTLQMLTFIRWSKNKYKQSTILKRLSKKQIILISVCFVAVWLAVYIALSFFGSSHIILDNTITLLGILATILMLFSHIEYTWISFISGIISIVLYIRMITDNPAEITYLIFTVYSTICTAFAMVKAMQLYKEQQLIKEND